MSNEEYWSRRLSGGAGKPPESAQQKQQTTGDDRILRAIRARKFTEDMIERKADSFLNSFVNTESPGSISLIADETILNIQPEGSGNQIFVTAVEKFFKRKGINASLVEIWEKDEPNFDPLEKVDSVNPLLKKFTFQIEVPGWDEQRLQRFRTAARNIGEIGTILWEGLKHRRKEPGSLTQAEQKLKALQMSLVDDASRPVIENTRIALKELIEYSREMEKRQEGKSGGTQPGL